MNYSVTYASLIVALLGYFGLGNLTGQEEVANLIDAVLVIGGIATAIYRRYKAGGVTVLGVRK